jgi:hypothetical protein
MSPILILYAIGNSLRLRIAGKVVHVNRVSLFAPATPCVFKGTDPFGFFCVYTNDRLMVTTIAFL